jgi:hypothetical protein
VPFTVWVMLYSEVQMAETPAGLSTVTFFVSSSSIASLQVPLLSKPPWMLGNRRGCRP